MLQFSELCRLCALKKKNKSDVFEDSGQLLLTKILNCLPIQVSREDMLPKMVCADCQRVIEQFNIFRTKCLKAEDKLNKMLFRSEHSKLNMVTHIKQEYLEPEFHETPVVAFNLQVECHKKPEPLALKLTRNVKFEVTEETDVVVNELDPNQSQDLVQIISDEVVHQQLLNMKQPHIEIIAEGYAGDEKGVDLSELVKKVHLNSEPEVDEESRPASSVTNDFEEPTDTKDAVLPMFINLNDIKLPFMESEPLEVREKRTNEGRKKGKRKGPTKKKSRRRDIVESDAELEDRDFHMGEHETCNVDMEAMEAVIKKKMNPHAVFECDKCHKSFKFFNALRKHKQTIHVAQMEVLSCKFCAASGKKISFQFSSPKCLRDHIKRKHSSNLYKIPCLACEKSFMSQGQLNVHMRRVHDKSSATCHLCNKTFKNTARLNYHRTVHLDERPFVCEQCGQSFKWNSGLKVHIQSMHKQEKNFLCSECGKKFATKKNLIEHLNVHTGSRPYTCKYCNASFAQMASYTKHEAQHREELRVHKCQHCDKAFTHAHMLKQHAARHSAARPYVCPVCGNTYKSQSDLCSHTKVHQEKQYQCSFCCKKFSLLKTLRDHLVRHTGVKHVCPVPGCGRSYTQRFPLTKHFLKHHPKLCLINRVGGKKSHLGGRHGDIDYSQHQHSIWYHFKVKDNT